MSVPWGVDMHEIVRNENSELSILLLMLIKLK